MSRKTTVFITIMLVLLVLTGCQVPDKTPGNIDVTVDTEFVDSVITELIKEEYGGRLTGSEGNVLAMDYVKSKYEEFGLQSPSVLTNDYMQEFTSKVRVVNETPILEVVSNSQQVIKSYDYVYDFGLLSYLRDTRLDGDVTAEAFVITENTVFTESLVKNKFGLVTIDTLTHYGVYQLRELTKGCYGLIIEYSSLGTTENPRTYLTVAPNVNQNTSEDVSGQMSIFVNPETFDDLLDHVNDGHKIHLKTDTDVNTVQTANIIGYLPTKNKKYENQNIIISAHLDHVGKNGDASYNPGALDNSSGIAALLEIARYLSQNQDLIKENVYFIAFNGEEEGLYGSYYYVENPVVGLSKTRVINLDMVGASANVPLSLQYCSTTGHTLATEVGEFASNADKVIYEEGRSSDHRPFCEIDIPSINIIHMDLQSGYHSPDDTKEDVSVEKLANIIKFVINYMLN